MIKQMIGKVMRHEWRVLSREKSVWLIVAVFALTIGYAVRHGLSVKQQQTAAIKNFEQGREDFLAQSKLSAQVMERELENGLKVDTLPEAERGRYAFGARQSSWIGTRDMYAVIEPTALSGLAIGQSELPPPAVLVTGGNTGGGVAGIPTENPLKLFIGQFDFSRIVIYLFPLFILGLTFNLLSGDRESEILGLIFAQPLTLKAFLIGKLGVRILIIFSAAVISLFASFFLSQIDFSSSGVLVKLFLCILIVFAYGLFWFGLALLVNGWRYSSGTNALILIISWLLFVFIVPSVINFILTTVYPLPNQAELITAARLAREEANNLPENEVIANFFASHPEFPPNGNYQGDGKYYVLGHSRLEEIDRRLEASGEQFNHQFAERQRALEASGCLSPAIFTQNALLVIAGNEPERYRHFLSQAAEYKKARFAFFRPKLFEITKFADPNFSSSDYDRIPRFSFQEEPNRRLIQKIALMIGSVLLQSLFVGILIRRTYKTYLLAEQ